MAQKRQGNRFAETPRLDAPRPPADLASEVIEARRAMSALEFGDCAEHVKDEHSAG